MRHLALASILFLASTAVWAGNSCPQLFVGGQAPRITNPKLAVKARELCFAHYDILHSGLTRTPLWSAEHLTAQQVEAAKGVERVNAFHEEEALPPEERAYLSDYSRSGYDRGHNTPSGDAPDAQSQWETFSLANMVPQAPQNNRGLWERIETATRNNALDSGELYVVTGPLFVGNQLQQLHGRVMVPTHLFKAIYNPKTREAAAYLVQNTDDSDYQVVSIDQIDQMAGFDVFPALSAAIKAHAGTLPPPEGRSSHRHRHTRKRKHDYVW
jgi:endonuclease G